MSIEPCPPLGLCYAEAGCSKEVGWWRWDLGNCWCFKHNLNEKFNDIHGNEVINWSTPRSLQHLQEAHLLTSAKADKLWILASSQGCFLGWTKPSKSSVLRKLHLGAVGELFPVFLDKTYMICGSICGGFSAGFSLDLISKANCCDFSWFFYCFIWRQSNAVRRLPNAAVAYLNLES